MAVMCEILGMPEEYNDRLVQAARDMLKGTETAIASNEYVMGVLMRLTAPPARPSPPSDFTSYLINHPAGLTDDEVGQHLRLVLIAAYEATANLLANVLRVVLTDPGFRAQLNGGQMTVPEAVEQSLWDEPPFSAVLGYFAKQDTELGGQRIRKGDGLLLGIAPGNVDPRVRPDLKANMQGNRSHLAFGGGPHECPGQDIGRAIADIGVDALLMRLPDVQLDGRGGRVELDARRSPRGTWWNCPVVFDPEPPQDVMRRPGTRDAVTSGRDWQVGQRRAGAEAAPCEPRPAVRRSRRPRPPNRRAGSAPGGASCAGGAATEAGRSPAHSSYADQASSVRPADEPMPAPRDRIGELQHPRQQLERAPEVTGRHGAGHHRVERIAEDRHAQRAHVHPQLVRLPGAGHQPVPRRASSRVLRPTRRG